jgi:hypothetical protein
MGQIFRPQSEPQHVLCSGISFNDAALLMVKHVELLISVKLFSGCNIPSTAGG